MIRYTRSQYLNDECTHQQYYAQFATAQVIDAVKKSIGLTRILASTDEHLNDIPLHDWDIVASSFYLKEIVSPLFKQAGYFYTLAGAVCIAKEAARQIQDAHRG